jgi:hypothetical protein
MPNIPKTSGLFGKGTVIEIMTRAPEKMPATPIPATALPTIKTVLDGATAQIREPTSKIKTAARKAHLT